MIETLKFYANNEMEDFIKQLVTAFNELIWTKPSFGGKKWGQIAKTAYKYWSREIDTALFLDTVFTLRHNSGVLFNKVSSFQCHTNEDRLGQQLQVQASAKGVEELIIELSKLHKEFEPDCVRFLERGRTFGWWKEDLASHCVSKKALQKRGENES